MRSSHILGEDEKTYEGASPVNNITSREYLYLQEPAKSLTQPFTGRHCIMQSQSLGHRSSCSHPRYCQQHIQLDNYQLLRHYKTHQLINFLTIRPKRGEYTHIREQTTPSNQRNCQSSLLFVSLGISVTSHRSTPLRQGRLSLAESASQSITGKKRR